MAHYIHKNNTSENDDGLCVHVQVMVLLCGTNNINQTAEQVCEGILEIVQFITEKQPKAQLVVVVGF